ncbi:reverse transcriptase domain-containing protein [Tanacetum coccineum]
MYRILFRSAVNPKFIAVDDEIFLADEHQSPAATQQLLIITSELPSDLHSPAPYNSEEVAEEIVILPTPTPSPLSPILITTSHIPLLPLPIPSQPPNSPTYVEGSLGSRAAGIRQRDALPSLVHETEMPEICLPLRKRPCRTTPGPGYEVGRVSHWCCRQLQTPTTKRVRLLYYRYMDDLVEPSRRDSTDHPRGVHQEYVELLLLWIGHSIKLRSFCHSMEERSRVISCRLAQSMMACDRQQTEGTILYCRSVEKQTNLRRDIKNCYQRKPTRLNPGATPPPVTDTHTTTSVTSAQLQAMIDEGVTAVLAARATTRKGVGGGGTEGVVDLTQWFERMETVFRISNCTVENQVKFATCTLMGIALTWWNSHARTVTNEVAYAMTWSDLKKKMTTKYWSKNEIKKIEAELMFPEETDKIERYVGGMPDLIYSSVVASKPKTMQEAIEMATELMDRRINTFAERQTENKRKFEDTPRNNQNQQPNKRQNTGRAYAAGNGDKKPYEGTKPLCPKPLQEGLPPVEEHEPGKWQRYSQVLCSVNNKGAFGLGRSTQGMRLVNSGGVWGNKETNKDAFGLAAAPHGVRLA